MAIIGAGIFASVRIVPLKIATMELHDFADEQVQAAGVSSRRLDEAKIIGSIVKKADELDIKLDKKQMKIDVGPGEIRLRMRHQVAVDLSIYTWVWDFDKTFTHLRM
jgi:hypothetical protein